MKYITRNSKDNISKVYSMRQYQDQEYLQDDDPELLQFDLNLDKTVVKIDLSQIRNCSSAIGIMYNGNDFYSGTKANGYFLSAITYLSISEKTVLSWKLKNDSYVEVTETDLKNLFELNSDIIEECFAHEAVLLVEIDNAKTMKELEAIDLNAGWPEHPTV